MAPFLTPTEHDSLDDKDDDDLTVPAEFVCPLTLEVMQDPVISKHGQNFERTAILNWLGLGHGTCPLTRHNLKLSDLITDHRLRMQIYLWKKKNDGDVHLFMNAPPCQIHHPLSILGFITIEDRVERSEDDPIVIRERQVPTTFARSLQRRLTLTATSRRSVRREQTTSNSGSSHQHHRHNHGLQAEDATHTSFRLLRFIRPSNHQSHVPSPSA